MKYTLKVSLDYNFLGCISINAHTSEGKVLIIEDIHVLFDYTFYWEDNEFIENFNTKGGDKIICLS